MAIATLERPATPAVTDEVHDELVRTARSLAHRVNNRLALPLGLLELLELRADIPPDLQLLFGPARQALEEMVIDVVHLEQQTRLAA